MATGASGGIPPRFSALKPYIVGAPKPDGERDMHCPLHEDAKRSASINFEKLVWTCFAKCGGGSVRVLMERQGEWFPPPGSGSTELVTQDKQLTRPHIRDLHEALMYDHTQLHRLMTKRGLSEYTIVKHMIGWDQSQGAFTLPVWDPSGDLVNIRFYNEGSQRKKIWNLSGHGASGKRLYPSSSIIEMSSKIIICEGEMDALLTSQNGFLAVTRTGAAKEWLMRWNKYFKGKIVYLCHDHDEAGEAANYIVAEKLRGVAKEIRIIQLPYEHTPDHGKDLTDFWMEHGYKAIPLFHRLKEKAELVHANKKRPVVVKAGLAEVQEATNVIGEGQDIRMMLTVDGKSRKSYGIPRFVVFSCGRDAGPMCASCPMNEGKHRPHKMRIENTIGPKLFEMFDTKTADLERVLKKMHGIPPKCNMVKVDIKRRMQLELLHARPSIEHMNGTTRVFQTIPFTSVGNGQVRVNETYEVTGALHMNPLSQATEFVATGMNPIETFDSKFKMTYDLMRRLSIFKRKDKQSILDKLFEIAGDLADYVTHIFKRPEMHVMMDLVWHSVLQFYYADQKYPLKRGWLELLVVGDTRMGKSECAMRLMEHYRAGQLVSSENSSLAGIIGGVMKVRDEQVVTWGIMPVNDRRLIVLDEVNALALGDIGKMTSVRSEGIARVMKIVNEETPARCRQIWIGNPRDRKKMSDFSKSYQVFQPLIGAFEDIARFDMFLTLRKGEVTGDTINKNERRITEKEEGKYGPDISRSLVQWAWTRNENQVVWGPRTIQYCSKKAVEFSQKFMDEVPLVVEEEARIKIARMAVAIAARTFSTDNGERILVRQMHVDAAISLLDSVYTQESFGYLSATRFDREMAAIAEENKDVVATMLQQAPSFMWYLADRHDKLVRLDEVYATFPGGKGKAESSLRTLLETFMITLQHSQVYRMSPVLRELVQSMTKSFRRGDK